MLGNGGDVRAVDDVKERVEHSVQKAIEVRQETQKAQEQWWDEKKKMTAVYDALIEEQEQLKGQRERLEKSRIALTNRIDKKARQLAEMDRIQQQIEPFLKEVIARLGRLLGNGPPFLTKERSQRVSKLKTLMPSPETAVSEKFRKVMEALVIEAEYGRSIEVHSRTIHLEGRDVLVNIFRLGRVSLFYQTLDHKNCGFFNVASEKWSSLPDKYNFPLQTAMEIATKRRPVEILTLPIGKLRVK